MQTQHISNKYSTHKRHFIRRRSYTEMDGDSDFSNFQGLKGKYSDFAKIINVQNFKC